MAAQLNNLILQADAVSAYLAALQDMEDYFVMIQQLLPLTP